MTATVYGLSAWTVAWKHTEYRSERRRSMSSSRVVRTTCRIVGDMYSHRSYWGTDDFCLRSVTDEDRLRIGKKLADDPRLTQDSFLMAFSEIYCDHSHIYEEYERLKKRYATLPEHMKGPDNSFHIRVTWPDKAA